MVVTVTTLRLNRLRLRTAQARGKVMKYLVAASIGLALGVPAAAHADLPGIETTRHGVVVSSYLPHCAVEDGTSGPVPCTWNVGYHDGNGRGISYIVLDNRGTDDSYDPVWDHSPTGNGWVWEGGPRSTSDCTVKWFGDHWTERCPDGTRQRIER